MRAILETSHELLSHDATKPQPIAEPELSHEEIVQRALAEPLETRYPMASPRIAEREARLEVGTCQADG